jgi:hypothetical protein
MTMPSSAHGEVDWLNVSRDIAASRGLPTRRIADCSN